MKPILFLFLALIWMPGCNNKNKSTGTSGIVADSATTQATSPELKKLEALQELTPYLVEEMKALLPAELDGDSASGQTAYINMGTGFAKAYYTQKDSARIELNIVDCGGSAGAGLYTMQFRNLVDNYSNGRDEDTRITEFKGEKAVEHINESAHTAVITYFDAGRLLITLEGPVTIGELKAKAGKLHFKG